MNILNIVENNFNSTISGNNIVIVDCWASWCPACKDFDPVYENVSLKNEDILFCKIDASKEKDLLSHLAVENIPTLLLYKEGILIFKQAGYFDEAKLGDILDQVRNLDMDLVRADIEKNQSEKG
jgi:thioredoxin 1